MFRWATKVLTGRWQPSPEAALADALRAAHADPSDGSITLREAVWIERKGYERGSGRHLWLAEAG